MVRIALIGATANPRPGSSLSRPAPSHGKTVLKLSWRIPTSGDPRLLRLGLAQVGLASIVAGLVLAVTLPSEWLAPALGGLIPLAVFMAYRRWKRYQDSMLGDDNVWLDDDGLHWLDDQGRQKSLRRSQVVSYQIAASSETMRPVPALTFLLKGGFESQPIELHPPATPAAVRDRLDRDWRLPTSPARPENDYDVRLEVFSECHPEFQEWHWEGTRSQLQEFFGVFAAAAQELALPPLGAKPLRRVVLASRRHPLRIAIGPASLPHLEDTQIFVPPAVLEQITASAIVLLDQESPGDDSKFTVELAPSNRWTFHLHIRNE